MAVIDVAAFLGISPMVGKEALPNEVARLAENCRLEGGDLESWNAPTPVKALTSLTPIKTIYRYGIASNSETDFWFQWDTDVDVVKGPQDSDIEERTYWTGDGAYPKKTKADIATVSPPYPTNHYRLGIPAPVNAPNVSVSGTATAASDPATTSVWGYTYVTTWDEEGPMSPLSVDATWRPGQTPQLSNMSGPPTGAYTINRKRIYRSATGTNATDMQFVAEIAVGTSTFDDNVTTLGRVAESRLWTPPPDDLRGLCLMANEIMAGFSGTKVRMSEPSVPYAWPARYEWLFPGQVIGIKPFGQSLLVCTTRSTHVLTGADPNAMTEEEITSAGVCMSKRGMVSMLDGVIYPTKLGLQYVGPGGPKIITAAQFDEREWAKFAPASFTAAMVNNRYVASYDTGVVKGSIIFNFVVPQATVTSTEAFTALWQQRSTDNLYVVQDNVIKRWDGGAPLIAKWRSKAFRFGRSINMAAARVEADTYPLTLKVFNEKTGVLIHTQTVENEFGFHLPDGYETVEYSFQYEGTGRVSRVSLATSMDELRGIN